MKSFSQAVTFLVAGILAITISITLLAPQVVAQVVDVSYGVANYISIPEDDIRDGQIVSSNEEGYYIANTAYDDGIVGVVTSNPAITFVAADDNSQTPVVSSGTALVLVTASNGEIRKGDPITTSEIRGIGMKLNKSGMIIGTALEDFNPEDPEEIKPINAKIEIKFHAKGKKPTESIFDIIRLALISSSDQPPVFFKYVTAGFVVLASILLGFYFFGRVAAKGIEAIGRNPLAGKMIEFSIVVNVIITIATIASGLIVAIIILRL